MALTIRLADGTADGGVALTIGTGLHGGRQWPTGRIDLKEAEATAYVLFCSVKVIRQAVQTLAALDAPTRFGPRAARLTYVL